VTSGLQPQTSFSLSGPMSSLPHVKFSRGLNKQEKTCTFIFISEYCVLEL